MRKLPAYIAGEIIVAVALASIPAVWALGWLSMSYLYATGFVMGCVFVSAGAAAQIVLTQVVPRERLVEVHANSALAGSTAEIAGPGLAGLLIKLVGAPFALLADAILLLCSVGILRGVRVTESNTPDDDRHFGRDLAQGLRLSGTTACCQVWRWWWALGGFSTRPPWWCKFCSPRARWALRSTKSA